MRTSLLCVAAWLPALISGCALVHERGDAGSDAAPIDGAPVDAFAFPDAPLPCTPSLHIELTPVARAQMAIFAEDASGARLATIRLTDAVAYRGLGNRPGASQMPTAFHAVAGRREGVLPFWAHERIARGGTPFPRVIFQDGNEGFLSHGSAHASTDGYFCIDFIPESLDAMSCASISTYDRGRFVTDADVAAGYAEPFEPTPGAGTMRPLSATSLYPPRRDVTPAANDHPDVARFASEALRAMPELDAVTMASPAGPLVVDWPLPSDWPAGASAIFVEVHTEADFDATHDATTHPTPTTPAGAWDTWSATWGHPGRGQPSVVFRVDVADPTRSGATASTASAIGYTTVDGLDGSLTAMDPTMMDDPAAHPGSGADRLRAAADGSRVRVTALCD